MHKFLTISINVAYLFDPQNNILLPIFFFMICTLLVLLPFYSSPSETGIGAAIAVSGIPVYFATIFWERKPKIYQNMIGKSSFLEPKQFHVTVYVTF
jgi:uncharacterized membrane protein